MKRIIFLLIGILALSVACQDEFVEPENSLKSAKYEKTKTFLVKGWAEVIDDPNAPLFTCTPEDFGIQLCSSGWVRGHENILGKFIQEQSTYEKQSCDVTMINDEPVVNNIVKVDVLRVNGDWTYATNHTFINIATGEIWGYSDYTGGTGRFEGITGTTYMRNASMDPETGNLSFDEEGEITLVLK